MPCHALSCLALSFLALPCIGAGLSNNSGYGSSMFRGFLPSYNGNSRFSSSPSSSPSASGLGKQYDANSELVSVPKSGWECLPPFPFLIIAYLKALPKPSLVLREWARKQKRG